MSDTSTPSPAVNCAPTIKKGKKKKLLFTFKEGVCCGLVLARAHRSIALPRSCPLKNALDTQYLLQMRSIPTGNCIEQTQHAQSCCRLRSIKKKKQRKCVCVRSLKKMFLLLINERTHTHFLCFFFFMNPQPNSRGGAEVHRARVQALSLSLSLSLFSLSPLSSAHTADAGRPRCECARVRARLAFLD